MNLLHVHELTLVGPGKHPANLKFKSGLNVISGASDTGKTFIYQCCAYILGGKETPKSIPEIDGYTSLKALIGNPEVAKYEFIRSLNGGDFQVFEFGNKQSSTLNRTEVFELIADFLGIGGKRLKKNKQNETVKMSFAAIRRFIMSDENNIISEFSPILGQNHSRQTEEKAAFKFVLSGLDDSDLIKSADNSHDRLRKTGKRIAFDDIIKSLKSKLGEYDPSEVNQQKQKLDESIKKLIEELSIKTSLGSQLIDKKKKLATELNAVEERLFSVNNNLVRFDLLLKTYQTDIDRIQFVVEGNGLFEQLNIAKCPYCESPMDHFHYKNKIQKIDIENLEAASKKELSKIGILIEDLKQAIMDLNEERQRLSTLATAHSENIRDLEKELSSSIIKDVDDIKERIKEINIVRDQVCETVVLHSELIEVEKRKQESLSMSYDQGNEEEESFNQDLLLNELCKVLELILKEWKIAQDARVSFNLEQYDIVIDGKARRSWGKGFRAILFTAFITSLRVLALKRNSFHPGLIILDSPLTTHEEADQVDSGIQEAVFRALSDLPHTQVILIDNKIPPQDLDSKINHIHFSGIKGASNQGFIPGF